MPVLKSHTMKLLEEHHTAPGEVFTRQFVYAGTAIDGRTLTNADIAQIYNDTVEFNNTTGAPLPIKIGHSQEGTALIPGDEELKGFVKTLELRESDGDNPDILSIWGSFHLYPEIAMKAREGRFPNQSIGKYSQPIQDSKGNMIESALDHLAILGASTPALSELNKDDTRSILYNFYTSLKGLFNRQKEDNNQMAFDTKQASELISTMLRGLDQLFQMAGNKSMIAIDSDQNITPPTDPEPKEETPPEPSYSAKESTDLFNSLVKDGNIAPDKRNDFDSLLDKTNDLDFVKNFYSSETAIKPPEGEKTTSNRSEDNISQYTEEIKKITASMGLTGNRAKVALGEEA